MIVVIVAGGSGTRLWPLSTPNKPKHLLKLGGDLSLLQSTYQRASKLTDTVYVLTDESHHEQVSEQIPSLDQGHLIVEPGRRGTANCITLALAVIAKEHGQDVDVAFFHADHRIQDVDGFVRTVNIAVKSARIHDSIALIGIKPEYPATGFGYIKVGEKLNGAYWVDKFEEKPDSVTAKKYVKQGNYLWNLGLFAAPISTFLKIYRNHAPELAKAYDDIAGSIDNEKQLLSIYKALKSQPIDTALIEKTPHIVVVPGAFDWIDIGNYKDLHDVLPDSDEFANAIVGDSSMVHLDQTKNSIVVTHNKPVAIIGVEDLIVVDTAEAILVAHKDYAQDVKKAAEKFKKN